MTDDTLTEIVKQWAQRLGQPPSTVQNLLAGRDAEVLRRAAAHFANECGDATLTNAQRAGWSAGAERLRHMASTVAGAPGPRGGARPATAFAANVFTPTERLVLIAVARGGDLTAVAARTGRGLQTVKTHLARMKKRSGATSIAHLLALAIAYGQVPVDVALGDDGGETE